MNLLLSVCLILGLFGAYRAGLILIKERSTSAWRFPLVTCLLAVAIAIPSTLLFFFPAMLFVLRRDYARFASGKWWRVITPLFVQDAGIVGVVFNLVSLLLVGTVAEQLWGKRQMIVIFFVGGVVSEVIAFAWQPIGAGNSLGNFSLAASVAVACLAPQTGKVVQITASLALSAYAVLLLLKDIHGAAALVGTALALALRSVWKGSAAR